jgi:hypothetical protein
MFAFASTRWADGDFKSLASSSLSSLGGPSGSLDDFVLTKSYMSSALGHSMTYVVVLPPNYYLDPKETFPVLYFLHGQGQKPTDLAASALLFLGPQMGSQDPMRTRAARSDWQKMMIVFADGQCPNGECHTGTFYADFQGVDGNGPKHEQAFFELMKEIDSNYRTKAPEMLPTSAPQ